MQSPISRLLALAAVITAVVLTGCSRKSPVPRPEPIVAPACTPAMERKIGEPRVVENVTVYPITSCAQLDPGPIVTLDEAIARGSATIHEVEGGGSVNTLVIENTGAVPLFVLAGTIVMGGKQDRQIGQDYLIGAKAKTDVDAFCVEHGRWTDLRDGKETAGLFRVAEVIATSKVRVAGQYEKNQGKVWAKVAETNTAHAKAPASDTLLASVDDVALSKERDVFAARLEGSLAGANANDALVGFAYAIDGEIKGARWFGHHRLYAMHAKKLLRSIALDAALSRAERKLRGQPIVEGPPPATSAVEEFLAGVDQQVIKEERDTKGANVNAYKESPKAYGSKMMLKSGSGKAASSATAKALSADVTAK